MYSGVVPAAPQLTRCQGLSSLCPLGTCGLHPCGAPWPAWVLLQGRGRAGFSSEAPQAGTDLSTGLLLLPGEGGAGRTPSTRPLSTTCSAGMALPCMATWDLPAVASCGHIPILFLWTSQELFMLWATPSSPPGPLLLAVPLPLAATPWSLCPSLRCEVLGSAGSSALPTRFTPPVSSPLASCLLSPDSTDSHLSSRHLHVDVRGPSAQPPSFPSNLSFSQFLTPSCCSKTTCMLVGSRF